MVNAIVCRRSLGAVVAFPATTSAADLRAINVLKNYNSDRPPPWTQMILIAQTQQHQELPPLNVSLTFELRKNFLDRY
jgi:hypothetical protein